jgi:hypothetical protein
MPGSLPFSMIFVFDRINGVGSVPSIQMYSALYGTDTTSCQRPPSGGLRLIRKPG